jgi:NAD(P)-dependent dehydrogenase (short-subunit alcohol dehydrogenase family)/pimeloyl-ACP methyl ester carboxylesterase
MTTTRERRWVTGAGGVELAVDETGIAGAPTVVLVHGYPDTSDVWDGVVDRLAERYHVVTYDVRGAGASGAPDRRDGYALAHLVHDLANVTRAVSPHRAVHLVGHDWGSVQGWEAVTTDRMAGRIASFTSMSGPGLDHVGQWLAARRVARPRALAELVRQGLRSWYVGFFHLPGATLFWRLGGADAVRRGLARAGELPAGAELGPSLTLDGARGLNLYLANVRPRLRHPAADRTTDVPVQLIVPTGDRYVTPALLDDTGRWASRLWRRDVPGGHWLPRTRPHLVADWVAELVDHAEGDPEPRRLTRARVQPVDARPGGRDVVEPSTRPWRTRHSVVVVTGAGAGIGRAVAMAFADRGAEVVAVDIDGEAAERTARLCAERGGPASMSTAHRVDVGDGEAMEALAKLVEHDHGGADVVVNNAGVAVAGSLLATSDDDWERLLQVNLWGVIHGSRLFARQMVDRGEGGHVVNVASAAAFSPSRVLPAYATTKAAVLMLTECLRAELAGEGIGVTAVCPGMVDSGIVSRARFVGVDDGEAERRRRAAQRLVAGRGYRPERVAEAVVRAVDRNPAVVAVTPEAHVARALYRIAPGLARRLARIDVQRRL